MINNSKIRILVALYKKEFLALDPAIIIAVITAWVWMGIRISILSTSLVSAFIVMSMNLGVDEISKIDPLSCSLPVKRSDIVFVKYLHAWITVLVLFIIPVLTTPLWRVVLPQNTDLVFHIENIHYPVIFMFNVCAIFFPVRFIFLGRFDKSILSFVFAASVAAIFVTLGITIFFLFPDMVYVPLFQVGLFFGTIGLSVLSISISNYVYKKKELAW